MRKILIGEGGCGRVYRIWDEEKEIYFAEKISRKPLVWEGIWMEKLQGFAVPAYYGLRKEHDMWILSMEYIQGRSFSKILYGKKNKTENLLLVIIRLLLELIKIKQIYPEIVFGDLKPSNIMVTRTYHIYFIDFGTISKAGVEKICSGTRPYAAPEIIAGKPGEKSDVYSIAQMIWEVFGWRKNLFYFKVLRPYLLENEEQRDGDIEKLLVHINKYLKLLRIWERTKGYAKRYVFPLIVIVVFLLEVWCLKENHVIIKFNM